MDETRNEQEQAPNNKISYPKGVPFIVGYEFSERFTFYGIRAILVIYLNEVLLFSQDGSTIIYHAFSVMGYLTCIPGAILGDGRLGRFRTIAYVSASYVIGCVFLTISAIGPLNLYPRVTTMLALLVIAFGSGGIKPCIAAFGGDQYQLPQQTKQMSAFFTIFYFAVNAGALLAMLITPLLRKDVHCFEKPQCFPLAFGVPTFMLMASLTIFILGKPYYIIKPPRENTCVLVGLVIVHALIMQWREHKTNPQPHFLDYAERKYGSQIVEDIKAILKILVLYTSTPLFWALFEQKGSRWTFQARKMNGELKAGIEIKPEQMQLMNSLLVLIFLPLFQYFIYPLLAMIRIKRPLQKLFLGGLMTSLAFFVAGFLETYVDPTCFKHFNHEYSKLRVFNGLPNCSFVVEIDFPKPKRFTLKPLSFFEDLFIDITKETAFKYHMRSNDTGCSPLSGDFHLNEESATSFFVTGTASNPHIERYTDTLETFVSSRTAIRTLSSSDSLSNVYFVQEGDKQLIPIKHQHLLVMQEAKYDLRVGKKRIFSFKSSAGQLSTILLVNNAQKYKVITIKMPKRVHMLWQIPQYILITFGEILFSVTGLAFSYSEAPLSMKTVLQAFWLLGIALGNLIVIIITRVKFFSSFASEFFLFGGLMLINIMVFLYSASRYVPRYSDDMSNDQDTKT